jgi:hypothetical protein
MAQASDADGKSCPDSPCFVSDPEKIAPPPRMPRRRAIDIAFDVPIYGIWRFGKDSEGSPDSFSPPGDGRKKSVLPWQELTTAVLRTDPIPVAPRLSI